MKRFNTQLISTAVASALMLGGTAALSAYVEVDWDRYSEYYDSTNTNEHTGRPEFRDRVAEELSDYFRISANKHLRPEQTLEVNIEDVSVAGTDDTEYFFTRFDDKESVNLDDVHFPNIQFTYRLMNQDGVLIEEGRQNVMDIGLDYEGSRSVNTAAMDYEAKLIDAWFEKTF